MCKKCKVIHELDLGGSNTTIIGEVVQTYSKEKYLTNHIPDLKKIVIAPTVLQDL